MRDKAPQRELDLIDAMLDTVGVLIMVLDPTGRIVRFNRACEQATGYRFAEVEGRPFWDYMVSGEVEPVERAFARIQAGHFPSEHETLWVTKDGSQRLIAWSNRAALGEDGSVEYVTSTGVDVTERRQGEPAMRESEEKLEELFDILPIGISVLDQDRNVLKANPALSRILDLSAEELRYGSFRKRRYLTAEGMPFPPEDFPSARAFNEQRVIQDVQVGVEKEDGELIWTSVSAVPFPFPDWKLVVVTTDITQRRRAEQELQHTLAESQQRQAEVSALLDGARQVLAQHQFEDTARDILETCKDLTGATDGYVALSSKDGTENEVLFLAAGGRPCTLDPALPMPIRGLRGQVYQTGSVASENDFPSSQWAELLPEGHVGVENLLIAPLVISGQVVGLLGLANKPGGFTENDERLAAAFGELAAIGLHNSRLMESLEASELRFRSVVETANAAIVTADSRGLISDWNRMAEKLFGYPAQEVIGAPLTRIMPERFRGAHQAAMQRALATGETRLAGETVETIGTRKGGDEFPLELSLATWKTGEGSFFTALMHDITQRRQTEEALREAKESMETLIAASPLAIIAFDLDLNVRLWNPAAERIFGWSEEEVLGRPSPLVSEARQEEFQEFLAGALADRGLSARETVWQRKDGSPTDVSVWTAPLYDAEGAVRNVMAVIADIGDRKRVEEALQQYAEEQKALYTVTSAVAGTLDQEELLPVILDAVLPAVEADAGWILLPNPEPEDPPQVVAQRGVDEGLLASEILLPSQNCPIYQPLSPGDEAWVEPRLVVACPALAAEAVDGSELHSLVCVPLCAGKRVLGVLKVGWRRPDADQMHGHDLLLSIGQQVGVALHSAQLYREARQVNRLRALSQLDRALAATLEPRELAEASLHHLATNLQAREATALLLLPEVQAQPMIQVYAQAEGWDEVPPSGQDATGWQGFVDRMADQKEPMAFAIEELGPINRDPKAAQAWGAHGLVVPIVGETALLALLVLGGRRADRPFTDEDLVLARVAASHAGQAMQNAQLFNEVRQLLRVQEETRARLIQSEKVGALGRLAATVAHEINNPLQAVQSCLTLAQEELDDSQRRAKVDRYLEVAGGEVRRISDIVGRMRDYYRPASERLQPTDIRIVLDSVLGLSGKELQHRHIAIERLDSSDLPLVQANPDHLTQVVLNLVLNAMDAMPSGGILRVRTSRGQLQPGDDGPQPAVCVEISDSGQGMPPEVQALLFEPFFTTKEQGAGLGLFISYNIIEAHHGQISVTSKQGEGTTFTILLPTAPS